MKHTMNKIRIGIISAIILIVCITTVSATPPIPESYWGYATLNGAPAPYGTSITVDVYGTGEVVGSTTVQDPNGGYSLDVRFDDSDTPEDEGANDGDQVTWKINAIECSTPAPGTDTATPGGRNDNFNIAATSADIHPSVTVLHPGGGESIPLGTQVQVSAHATDDTAVTSVTFSYSNNSGSDWNSIGVGTRVSGTDKDGAWNRTWNTNGLDAGSNYLIKAAASDGTSTREDQSDSTFSLTCTPPSAPALNDPGTTDTDGSYTVSWSSVSGATSYTLEEDTSGLFGSPTVVYSGSGMSKYITGRSDGTYYYRVKACNACGCSGWSNVGDIEVEIPDSDIIRVPEDYSTIQAAVDAASSGCTIQVSAGTYIENLVVYKPLTLIGADRSTTVINGDGSEDIIRVTANGCTISGFTIQGSDDCDWEEKTLATGEIWDLGGGFALTPVQIDVDGDKVWFSFTKGDKEFDSVVVSAGDTYTFTATIDGEEDVPVLFCYAVGMYRGTESTFVQIRYVLFEDHVQGVDTDDTAGEVTGVWPIAGIELGYADNNTVTNNEIRSCDCGIRLRYSATNVITANIASRNNHGIVLRYSSNSNIIYHNNLINNTWGNAYDGGSANQWDFDAQGNHYSDYNGTDPDGDGIGNDPHHIPGGSSVDRYPLMQPWGGDTPPKGDLNSDHRLTPADAAIALQIAATGAHDDAADVSRDGRVTSLDALMILHAGGGRIKL